MSSPIDLTDAVLQELRASDCAVLFGDTWNPTFEIGIPKFFCDYADSVSYPIAVIGEVGEGYDYFTRGPSPEDIIPFIANGTLQITITAFDRVQARTLGLHVGLALNDADLSWTGGRLMGLRLVQASFIPNPPPATGSPTLFVRALTFAYTWQGSL